MAEHGTAAQEQPTPPSVTDPAAAPRLLHRLGAAADVAGSLGGERSPWRRRAAITLGVLALAFLAYTVVRNWERLPEIEWRFQPGWVAVSVAALIGYQAIQAQLWTWLLRSLGSPLPTPRAWAIWNVTLLARYVPSNLGMVVGRTAMSEREGVPKRVTMASIALQLGTTFAGAAAVGAYFVIALPDLQNEPVRYTALAVPVVALIALDPAVFHRVANFALQRLGRETLPLSLSRLEVLGYTALSALSFVVAGVAVWAFAEAIHGVDASHVATAIGSYSVGYAVAVLTLVLPGGLGAREGAMVAALLPALPATVGVAVAVAIRLLQIAVEVVFATLTPVWARRSERGSAPS